jgi:hypothetical protein
MSAAESIARVVPDDVRLSPVESDAVVEIAYVTIAADRRLDPAEVEAFRAVIERLRRAKVAQAELDRVMNEMYGRATVTREEGDEHLRALAAKMSVPARELAYKVAYAMSVADLEASDEEFELDLQLVDALELTSDRAEALQAEVMAKLNPSS